MRKQIIYLMLLLVLMPAVADAGDIKGKVTCKGVRDNRDAVVYVEEVSGETKAPKEHAVMDQKNVTFIPHVLSVVKGTTVDFLNSDDVLHNVFTPEKCAEKFNLGSWPKGQTKSYTFKTPGCQPVLLCNVHPEMEAWVVVLQNPYYYKTDKDGVYEIKNVPAGKYKLAIWHEKLKSGPVEVSVPESGSVEVDFTLKK